MPNFKLTQQEAQAVTTALLGFVKDLTVQKKIKPRTPENLSIEEGEKIVRQMNCQACHTIEGEGGAVQDSIKEWLIKSEKQPEADAAKLLENSSPPNLHGLGKKAKPDWLFEFLHDPSTTTVRPWLKIRMPTYTFNVAHLNLLVKYFNALDKEEFPFAEKIDTSLSQEEYKMAENLFSLLDCMKCHVVGSHLPTGTKDTWAPNLMVAKTKLKPEWIIHWIQGPNKLLPGTKMPAFLDTPESGPEDVLNGDENEQVRVLRNYLLTITNDTIVGTQPAIQAAPEKPAAAPTEAPNADEPTPSATK